MQKKEKEAAAAQQSEQVSEAMVDTAPVLSPSLTPPLEPEVGVASGGEVSADVSITAEELKELNQAVQQLKELDRTELEELKEDREEYIEVMILVRFNHKILYGSAFVKIILYLDDMILERESSFKMPHRGSCRICC